MGDNDGGVMFVGSKGKIITGCYARNPRWLPKDKFQDFSPTTTRRLVPGGRSGHEKDWIRACKEDPSERVQPKSSFEFAGPFNEVVVMGTVAARLSGLKRILRWDGANMKFTNIGPDEKIRLPKFVKLDLSRNVPRYNVDYKTVTALEYAENLIKRKPRKGWELKL